MHFVNSLTSKRNLTKFKLISRLKLLENFKGKLLNERLEKVPITKILIRLHKFETVRLQM